MPLSRLENFLKNVEGNILYVNPTDLDATDSIENQGNSLTRPFKTIQRALLEASRFSYNIGQDNDKFDRTTVLLYPGDHEVDNRPGFNVVNSGGNAVFRDRLGNTQNLLELTDASNYNIDDPTNELYKYNSVEGGVIVPRGVSIAGYDVRKTKIRAKFVPDPADDTITRAAMFRLTGGCHFYAVSFFDANPKGSCYKNYTNDKFATNLSHHKLTVFEYADGVNGVGIGTSSTTTDLSMYFNKVQKAFGDNSGRAIGDFPATADMQPTLPEYEMVGPVKATDVGISSIKAGTGASPSATITVETTTSHGLVVDSAIRIAGVNTYPTIYNGNFVVSGITSERIFTYEASSSPADGLPTLDGDEVIIADTDNVTGSSPYIFHCSMRSAYGMCGLHADGSKSSGFKSMLVSQFTGIGLQKDNNAFLLYNKTTGQYDTNATAPESEKPLYLNGNAIYSPSYKNSHIKCSNDGYIQAVSIFAVGFSEHFTTANGGDMSITNSNSNFGAVSLNAKGFKAESFAKDNRGYVTHIIPPENQFRRDISVEWEAIDATKTLASTQNQQQIHLDGFTDSAIPPVHVIGGYRIGAKSEVDGIVRTNPDLLHVSIAGVGTYSAEIRMQDKSGDAGDAGIKQYEVTRTGLLNSISNSIITLKLNHSLYAGESIRVISDDGYLPDGLDPNVIYYAVTNDSTNETLNANQIKLARNKNDALLGGSGNFITINNNKGGVLTIESRVSDKSPGDLGHPIQYNSTKNNWYITVQSSSQLWSTLVSNAADIGARTGKTFIKRQEDTRSLNDKIYRLRYVIPKESSDARPPIPGYTLQETSTVGVATDTEFTSNIPDVTIQRNLRILKSVDRDPNTGITTIVTEKPHNLVIGDAIQLKNVKTSGNTTGDLNKGYNIVTDIVGITSSKGLELDFYENDPGTFVDTVSDRGSGLPTITRRTFKDTFTVYRAETVKSHDYQRQDGVYHLICVDSSISPTVNQFTKSKFNQNIADLYPQFDSDNFNMDPSQAASFALNKPIGKVITNDLRGSITKEFTNNFIVGNRIGYAVTGAISNPLGITTVYSNIEHNLNSVIAVGSLVQGSGYGSAGIRYNVHLTGGDGKGATANLTVNGSGNVTAVTIVDGGAGYTVGNTLTANAGGNNCTVAVSVINNNIGDAIQIVGVGTEGNRYDSGYNGIHTVTKVTPKSVEYKLDSGKSAGIWSGTTAGIHTGFFMLAGNAPRVNSIVYSDRALGIATVTTDEPHGLSINNPFKIVGAAQTIYNGTHLVYEKESTTKFSFKFKDEFTPTTYTTSGGKAQVLPILYGAKGGKIGGGNERLAERQVPFAVGISTTLNGAWSATSTTLSLNSSNGFVKGDYIQIDDEIIRVSSDFSSNQATVLRGQLGSRSESHLTTSIAKKIRVLPVEKRRASVLRASGHTFEYLGFGPGNYSTSFPEKQDRILSREEKFLAQATIDNGGSVVYTGMNDAGDFYIGNKVVNSQDGTESTFNVPIPTSVGSVSEADATSGRLDVIFDSVTVREGMTIDGDNNTTVRINAPTTLTEKLTSSSTNGAEFYSIDLTGGLSPARTITYVNSTPSGSSTLGDIVFKANPDFGDHIGWVYTTNGWKRFGLIATEKDDDKWSMNVVGLGSTSASRAGTNVGAGVSGALDIRGQLVADYLLMTGISTFLGTTNFAKVVIGKLDVTDQLNIGGNDSGIVTTSGISTFRGGVIFNSETSGITTFANRVGFSSRVEISGAGNRVVIQKGALFTIAHGNINTSNNRITQTDHGWVSGEKIKYVSASGTKIGGLDLDREYWVLRVSKDVFSISATNGGAAINLTSAPSGNHVFKSVEGQQNATGAGDVTGAGLQVDQLNVVGVVTFPSQTNITNVQVASMKVTGISTLGVTEVSDTLEVTNATTLNSTLDVIGNTDLQGNVDLGNATGDTITATGRFDSDLVPSTDNTRDLGASSLEWKDLYLDGTANIDSLLANTAKIGDLSDNRVVIAGASGELEDSGNLTFDGSTLSVTGDIHMDGTTAGRDAIWDRSADCLRLQDNTQLRFGTNSDTRLYHNDTNFMIDNQKGHIYIQNGSTNDDSNIYIRARDAENSIVCSDDGSVTLYHDNRLRLTTTSGGVTLYSGSTGSEAATGSLTAGAIGATSLVSGTAKISDLGNDQIVYSSAADGELSSGSNLTWSGSGTLALTGSQTISSSLTVTSNITGSNDFTLKESNGDTGLHWDKSDNALTLSNNIKLKLGELAAGDTQIYSTGSHFYIDNNDGHIYIRNNVDDDDGGNIYLQAKSGENGIIVTHDSHVRLYHDNEEKLRTNTGGITIYSGNGTGTGTVTANLSGTATNADNINVDESSSNTDYQVLFSANQGAGYQRPYIDSGSGAFKYNPSTNRLTVNAITSTLTGNVTGNVTGDVTGDLSGTATNANYINVDESSSNTDYQVLFSANQGAGYQRPYIDTQSGQFKYNPNTNRLTVGSVYAAVTGNVTGNASGSSGSCTGNAATATKWSSSRTITLTGDITGNGSIQGNANCTISTTLASASFEGKTKVTVKKSGSGNITTQSWCKTLVAAFVGGGGGGGQGAYFNDDDDPSSTGYGGAGGTGGVKFVVKNGLSGGNSYSYSIGGGGSAGSGNAGNGGNGGNTTFAGSTAGRGAGGQGVGSVGNGSGGSGGSGDLAGMTGGTNNENQQVYSPFWGKYGSNGIGRIGGGSGPTAGQTGALIVLEIG